MDLLKFSWLLQYDLLRNALLVLKFTKILFTSIDVARNVFLLLKFVKTKINSLMQWKSIRKFTEARISEIYCRSD